jgi:sulfur-carrier protein
MQASAKRDSTTMTIIVKLFAATRDMAGADSLAVELSAGATVADLRAELARRVPALKGLLSKSAIAVNHDFAEDSHILKPADEVAIIPPVSGG